MNSQTATIRSEALPSLYVPYSVPAPVSETTAYWLARLHQITPNRYSYSIAYRLLNIFFALALSLVALPLLMLGILLVKFASAGPIFYRQTRLGLMGQKFTIYKLRTMVMDAEEHSGVVWARHGDERITSVGRFLRTARLDELPQLWNVLRGEMSLVGPRPERPEFFDYLCSSIPDYYQRLLVRPGLTGWAQVNNGYTDSVDATRIKLKYDLYYVNHQNYALDLKILWRTIWVVLSGHGAR